MGCLPCCSSKKKNKNGLGNSFFKGDPMKNNDKAVNDLTNFINKTTNINNKKSSNIEQLNTSNLENSNSFNNNETKNMNNKVNKPIKNINNNIKITNNIYFTNNDNDNLANPKEKSLYNENYNVGVDDCQNNAKTLRNKDVNMNYSGNEIIGSFSNNADVFNNKNNNRNNMLITNQLYQCNNSNEINY